MTNDEFSLGFDILYNNVASNQAPGLNEEEKSFFLNKAQKELVKNYFSSVSNPKGRGFDDSEKRQYDFSTLVKTGTLDVASGIAAPKIHPSALTYKYKSDIFIPLNEIIANGSTAYTIVPISYMEFSRLMCKPYKYPPKGQVWRLENQSYSNATIVNIIGRSLNSSSITYTIRYVKMPSDIDLTSDTSVCELPSDVHDEVLQRAVELAKQTWQGDLQSSIQLGQRSE